MINIVKSFKKLLYIKIILLLSIGVVSIYYFYYFELQRHKLVLPLKFTKNVNHNENTMFLLRPWRYESTVKKYFVTFLIKSAIKNGIRRNLIRETWGSVESIDKQRFGIIFMIGKSEDQNFEKLLRKENSVFGDILQSDVSDSYRSLPEKVLSGFKFISTQKDIKTDYIVTTDDDCYVSLPQFYEVFKNKSKMNNIHCGFSYGEAEKPLRDKSSKYYISREIYSSDFFPPFCHGGMVVLSQNHLIKLYETSLITEKGDFFLEDVFIYGILRKKYMDKTSNKFFTIKSAAGNFFDNIFQREKLVYHFENRKRLSTNMRKYWSYTSETFLNFEKHSTDTKHKFKTKLKKYY